MILRRYHFLLLLLMLITGAIIWLRWCFPVPWLHYAVVVTHVGTGLCLVADSVQLFVRAELRRGEGHKMSGARSR